MSANYDKIKGKIQAGLAIKAKYKGPGGARHLVPYALGHSPDASGKEMVLGYEYDGPIPNSPHGWRCYVVTDFASVDDSTKPMPNPLPVVDYDRQNCVVVIDVHR
jgi:hypothetical protein